MKVLINVNIELFPGHVQATLSTALSKLYERSYVIHRCQEEFLLAQISSCMDFYGRVAES